jgi:hypothetical protein
MKGLEHLPVVPFEVIDLLLQVFCGAGMQSGFALFQLSFEIFTFVI